MITTQFTNIRRESERGFTLLETVLATALLFVAVVLGMQFLMVRSGSILLLDRQHRAEEVGESALTALAAHSVLELPAGSTAAPFTLDSDNTISIDHPCQAVSCDAVFADGSALSSRTSAAAGEPLPPDTGGVFQGDRLPTFVRRWRIDPIDAQRNLYRITVVVTPNLLTTQPLAVRSVDTVLQLK